MGHDHTTRSGDRGRIIQLLGALAAGYTWVLRNHPCSQQEEANRALAEILGYSPDELVGRQLSDCSSGGCTTRPFMTYKPICRIGSISSRTWKRCSRGCHHRR